MIKLEKTEVMGWEAAIRGMRNPMNSWKKSDTIFDGDKWCMGKNDLELMLRLRNAGTDHRKFMRMITAYVDITAPLYWWKEFDTYKVGTVANSCSTMHKIAEKEFTIDDFSHEHLIVEDDVNYIDMVGCLKKQIDILNEWRLTYLDVDNSPVSAEAQKKYWWQMIQLLPSSYNQKRTVMLNYEVLANIYKSRKNHKLDEWRDLCKWIESLPYSEIIIGERQNLEEQKIHVSSVKSNRPDVEVIYLFDELEKLTTHKELINIAIEEMAELTQCITKRERDKINFIILTSSREHFVEEFADVLVCLQHLRRIFSYEVAQTNIDGIEQYPRPISMFYNTVDICTFHLDFVDDMTETAIFNRLITNMTDLTQWLIMCLNDSEPEPEYILSSIDAVSDMMEVVRREMDISSDEILIKGVEKLKRALDGKHIQTKKEKEEK